MAARFRLVNYYNLIYPYIYNKIIIKAMVYDWIDHPVADLPSHLSSVQSQAVPMQPQVMQAPTGGYPGYPPNG